MTTTQDYTTQERIDGLSSLIRDAEWRIGSYIVQGNNVTDQYVKDQMEKIYNWAREIGKLSGMYLVQ